MRLDLCGQAQCHNLSCEARGATDLLAYYGVLTTEEEFQGGLPRSDNPDLGFVGHVDDPCGRLPPEGYGVHAEPVARRMRELGVPAQARLGADAAWLRDRLAEGSPVLVWSTADLAPRRPVSRRDAAGRTFFCVAWEHVLLAVGFDSRGIAYVDPATGEEEHASWARFLAAWESLGRMAVWVPRERMAPTGSRVRGSRGALPAPPGSPGGALSAHDGR